MFINLSINLVPVTLTKKYMVIMPSNVPKKPKNAPLNIPRTELPAIIVTGSGNGNIIGCKKLTIKYINTALLPYDSRMCSKLKLLFIRNEFDI